jgi:zinc transport system permease protein
MTDAPTLADLLASLDLFYDPILCAVIGGAVLGWLSVFVVLRRMVFVSAAVTQAAALGVAMAFYVDIHHGVHVEPMHAAALLSIVTTLVLLIRPRRLSRESVLGLAYALAGGAAVLVGSRITQEAHDIQAILFGTAVLVRHHDLIEVIRSAVLVMVLQLWWFRGLCAAAFDETAARVRGLPVRLLGAVVMLSVGVMVGVTARALGALPVFALSTLPAMAALAFRVRLSATFALAALLGAVSGGGGYVLSFLEDLPVGASQTAIAALFALVSYGVAAAVSARRRPG